MRSLVLAAALALPGTALASSASPQVVATPQSSTHPWLGLSLDAGVPSGLAASAQVRPLSWLSLYAGGGTNGAGAGVHAGATLRLPAFIAPTLTLEGGHFFEGNANAVASAVGNIPDFGGRMLERVGYDWASAQLGVELGFQQNFVLFLRGGPSYVDLTTAGTSGKVDDRTTYTTDDFHFDGFMPSAKLGFILWFG